MDIHRKQYFLKNKLVKFISWVSQLVHSWDHFHLCTNGKDATSWCMFDNCRRVHSLLHTCSLNQVARRRQVRFAEISTSLENGHPFRSGHLCPHSVSCIAPYVGSKTATLAASPVPHEKLHATLPIILFLITINKSSNLYHSC